MTVAGTCTLEVSGRGIEASGTVLLSDGSTLTGYVKYMLQAYSNVIEYNNTDGSVSYRQSSSHSSAWTYRRRRSAGRPPSHHPILALPNGLSSDVHNQYILLEEMRYSWANSGEFVVGGIWENSFNFTGGDVALNVDRDMEHLELGDVGVGLRRERSQRHYQRLELLDVTNSICIVPPDITHTVFLRCDWYEAIVLHASLIENNTDNTIHFDVWWTHDLTSLIFFHTDDHSSIMIPLHPGTCFRVHGWMLPTPSCFPSHRTLDTGDAWAPDILQTATASWAAVEPNSTRMVICYDPHQCEARHN